MRPAFRALFTVAAFLMLSGCGDSDSEQLARGASVYAAHCASCHGAKLEGQPNWKDKLANGRMPAPPHDDSGHTWQHTDKWLFLVVENGMVAPLARHGYESDMPAFRDKLSTHEIRAVLAYIKSHWSEETLRKREEFLSKRRARAAAPKSIFAPHP